MRAILGLVVALALGLLASLIVNKFGGTASSLNATTEALAQISTLQQTIPSDLGGMAGVASLSNAMVINDKDAPSDMVSNGALVDPWGGAVTVGPDASPGLFDITDGNVPSSACSKLVSGVSQYNSVSINGSAMSMPIDMTSVSSACTGGSNNVTFAFTG